MVVLVAVVLFGVFAALALLTASLASGIRPADIARPATPVLTTVISCLLVWPLFQLATWAIVALRGPAAVDPVWAEAPVIDRIAAVVNPILINSMPEEIVYRAVVIGLGFELFRRRMPVGAALALAVALSSIVFAIGHIPIAIIDGRGVPEAMVGTVVGGLTYAVLYIVTRNVVLVAVVHGVGNAGVGPGFSIVESGVISEPLLFAVLLIVGLLAAIPLWIARRRRSDDGSETP